MHKKQRFLLWLALCAAASAPLLSGLQASAPAREGGRPLMSTQPLPAENGRASAQVQERPAGMSHSTTELPVRATANNREAAAPQRTVTNTRPAADVPARAVANSRPVATPQRTVEVSREASRPAAAVIAPARRPISRFVLPTPRPLPVINLPQTVQLDSRCARYNAVMLRPYTIAARGNMLELVDGSVWHIAKKKNRRKVRHWSLTDNIIIESTNFLGWTSFHLVNYTRGESVEASLTLGSTYEGHASHWVAQYDPARRFLVLEDGSKWSFAEASFADWRENDAVVLGLSKAPTGSYMYMLINTRTLKSSLAINLR